MSARCEMVVDGGMDRKKALGGPGRSKALHRTFSSANANVRSFDAIILPFRLVMPSVEPQITKRCRIGSPFIGDDSSRCETMLLQKFAHQLQRRPFVAPRLNQDVEHLTVLVDRPPQIYPATADRDIQSSGPGEFHPQALTDPDVSVSTHPAPTVQPVPDAAIANAQITPDPGDLSLGASAVRVDGAASSVDISTSPSVPGGGRGVLTLGKVPICGNGQPCQPPARAIETQPAPRTDQQPPAPLSP